MHRHERPAPPPDTAPLPDGKAALPAIVAAAFVRLEVSARARMLGRLLAPLGPTALAAVAGGAFAKYVTHARLALVPVTLHDAARATAAQVQELARAIQQTNPQVFERLLELLARDATTIAALSAAIAALTLERATVAHRERRR